MSYAADIELIADAILKHQPADAWTIARLVLAELERAGRLSVTITDELRGDGPCGDCGTEDNIRWFTDSVLWNQVLGGPGATDDPGGLLCIPCFVNRTDEAGYWPRVWRLLPEWHWETRQERAARHANAPYTTEAVDVPR